MDGFDKARIAPGEVSWASYDLAPTTREQLARSISLPRVSMGYRSRPVPHTISKMRSDPNSVNKYISQAGKVLSDVADNAIRDGAVTGRLWRSRRDPAIRCRPPGCTERV